MAVMNKITAAYLAGLIDGEGSLEIRKEIRKGIGGSNEYYRPRVRITLTTESLIKWLKESFGGWICKRHPGNPKWADSYEWVMMGSSMKPILDKITPYLRIKKEHAEILKKFLKTFDKKCYETKNIGNKFTGENKVVKETIWKEREKLYYNIRKLNKKGKPLHAERLSESTLNTNKGCDSPTLLVTRD